MTELQRPIDFRRATLVATDFDETVASTSDAPSNVIGVNKAYELSIVDTFGGDRLWRYRQQGGLNNDDPRTVVERLLPRESADAVSEATSELTERKVAYLLGSIGTELPDGSLWPNPVDGYLEFRTQVEAIRRAGQVVDELILSSGHDVVINAVFEMWGQEPPKAVVATEQAEEYSARLQLERTITKPDHRLFELAFEKWRALYGLVPDCMDGLDDTLRTIYVGDDPVKDGGMVRDYISYHEIDPENPRATWQNVLHDLLARVTV